MGDKKRVLIFILSIVVLLVIIFLRPFGLDRRQTLIFGLVVLTITWWSTKVIDYSMAAVMLVVFFLLWSGAPVKTVLRFPLSANFILLITVTMISEGVITSGLSDRLSKLLLNRYGTSGVRLVALAFITDLVSVFFIPHPFPRVIMLTTISQQYLNENHLAKEKSEIIAFSVHVAATATSMVFLNGDVLLNNMVLNLAGSPLTWLQWALYMSVPGIAICLTMFLTFILTFKKEILSINFPPPIPTSQKPLDSVEKKALVILAIVTIAWMTEPLHGLSMAIVSTAGAIIMALTGLIKTVHLKKIDLRLIAFLTAAFSIGEVLTYTGVSEKVFVNLAQFMPNNTGLAFFLFVVFVSIILHTFIGSTAAALAVIVPGLLILNSGLLNPITIVMTVYVATSIHYLLPFHNVIIMLGASKKLYRTSYITKYSWIQVLTVILSVLLFLIPWWKLINLL